ncbi:MAG: Spo0B domain-containing protein [Clostridiales bacterium]|nr:Spo0B domain-containing protein [Clostridiales bacterium]MDY5514711.1 Spo0B domain-containing protein [Candidatus Ventricola sp.]
MKLKRIREDMRDHVKMRKAALLSIAVNVLEIAAGIAMVVLVNQLLSTGVEETIARMTSVLCLTVVGWGAVTDIGASLTSLRMVQKTRELEEAYSQMESLNREMRAQRHDFMNHIQVVYSLIEMDEPGEAVAYMDKIYGDMQRVSKMLRTDCPAVNALIQAKVVEAQQRGAELKLSIAAKWDDPMMPSWEICRVLANLIDNALDATCAAKHPEGVRPTVELVLGEDLRSWFFSVRNNGPEIPKKTREHIFEPGFTTKATGQGMGLFIVSQTITGLGGRITLESHEGDTVFSGFVPRRRLQLAENSADGDAQKDEVAPGSEKCEETGRKG